MRYRKKPVTIEAYQTDVEMDIPTLEGTMHASVGDYIITGVRGERYPCKPDIFLETYEPAEGDDDATLGREDTYTREDVEGAFVSGYSLGLDMFDSSKPEKGWNQNERNIDEEMEDLGWVRKDAAKLGSGTCELVNAADDLGKGTQSCMCDACGYTALDDWWDEFKFCPNCGRKVVDA